MLSFGKGPNIQWELTHLVLGTSAATPVFSSIVGDARAVAVSGVGGAMNTFVSESTSMTRIGGGGGERLGMYDLRLEGSVGSSWVLGLAAGLLGDYETVSKLHISCSRR